MALLQAISKRVLDAEAKNPGTVAGPRVPGGALRGAGRTQSASRRAGRRSGACRPPGLRSDEIDELAGPVPEGRTGSSSPGPWGSPSTRRAWPPSRRSLTFCCCAATSASPAPEPRPIRGHSNVQGDRTMGIWEQMPPAFLDALGKEFSFDPPREHGADAVETIRRMRDGGIKVFVALGGNLVAAISDTHAAEAAMENTDLTVQISTKLNRSHTVTGKEALILPTMGRTEIDLQESGPQFVSVEDTVCAVHPSAGRVQPVAPNLLSEVAIVCRTRAGDGGGKVQRGLGRIREELRPHPRAHLPCGGGLRGLQQQDPPGRRLRPAQRPEGFAHFHHRQPARPC